MYLINFVAVLFFFKVSVQSIKLVDKNVTANKGENLFNLHWSKNVCIELSSQTIEHDMKGLFFAQLNYASKLLIRCLQRIICYQIHTDMERDGIFNKQ